MKICNHISCNYPVFGKGYCKAHQYCRTDKKPKQPKKPKPIKPISLKLSKKLIEYRKLRYAFMSENQVCQAKLEGCSYYSSDVHHKAGRQKNLNNVDTWMSVCRACHSFIHNNPIEAKKMKFVI